MPILKSVYFNRFTFSHISPSCLTSLILPGSFFCTFITHVASCLPQHLYFISSESRNGSGADCLDCLCNRPQESTVLTLLMPRLQAPGTPISFLCDCQHCEVSPHGCMANTLLTESSSQSKKILFVKLKYVYISYIRIVLVILLMLLGVRNLSRSKLASSHYLTSSQLGAQLCKYLGNAHESTQTSHCELASLGFNLFVCC